MSLFLRHDFDGFRRQKLAELQNEIRGLPRHIITTSTTQDLVNRLTEKYQLSIPTLHPENRHALPPEPEGANEYTTVLISVPYSGDERLFHFRYRTVPLFQKQISTTNAELRIPYRVRKSQPKAFLSEFDQDIQRITNCLGGALGEVQWYHTELRDEAARAVNSEKAKYREHDAFLEDLESIIPLTRRNDGNDAVITPVQRKQIATTPTASTNSVPPEPVIEMKAYDEILAVITSMISVVERSPSVFREMEEEDLRTILLVGLNGIFQGKATGETFNGEGKNDILIRERDKNLFIAECLMWKGPEYLLRKLDEQLFRYATWRDSKLAVLVFNRNKNFTQVIQKMREVCDGHPQKKKSLPYPHESAFRYSFRRRDDPQREFTLTAMAFDVPA